MVSHGFQFTYGDWAVNSFTFYYSDFTNCGVDYGCWDTNGQRIGESVETVNITNATPNTGRNISDTNSRRLETAQILTSACWIPAQILP